MSTIERPKQLPIINKVYNTFKRARTNKFKIIVNKFAHQPVTAVSTEPEMIDLKSLRERIDLNDVFYQNLDPADCEDGILSMQSSPGVSKLTKAPLMAMS